MGRTRRALAATVVVGSLLAGSTTACTGPPPTQTDLDNLGRGLAQIFWLTIAQLFGVCWAPCDPAPGGS